MRYRSLGREKVSELGLGCMGLTWAYGDGVDERRAISVIHRALELGINLLDTADAYGPFTNEQLVGKAIGDRRGSVLVATKFGLVRTGAGSSTAVSGKPDYVKAACESSLKRLGIDCIDLYYQHRVDPEVPIEDTVGAMAELVREGKVKYLGLSEAAPDTIRRAHAVHPITALQTEFSLWSRNPEAGVLALCRELGITFVAYSPLGRGFLTGRFRSPDDLPANDWRRTNPRFQGQNFTTNLALADRVRTLAERRKCTPAQFALAWVLAKAPQGIAIPGTTSLERLEENARAVDIELTRDELSEIDRLFPTTAVSGERYPEAMMGWLDG
jgi:aryl-alcohol dehydrogenase-like predicted oxidoreductase